MQGNLRLGQVQLKAGSVRSTVTWYGVLPLPWHLPHTSESVQPRSDHVRRTVRPRAAFTDLASGARASTCCVVHRVPAMHAPVPGPSPGPEWYGASPAGPAGHDGVVIRDDVMLWVAGYEQAWREGDLDAVDALFTPDVVYRRSPYMDPDVGIDAIKAFWLDDDEVFTMEAEPVAVDGDTAVVRVEVRYGEPVRQEYRDLWVLRFADDGRVAEFEEWPFFPGRPYAAPVEDVSE